MKDNSKHTPGPWKILDGNYSPKGSIITINKSISERICEIRPTTDKTSGRSLNYNANAYLIAAAPELLEACIIGLLHMQDYLKENPNAFPQSEIDFMENSISKAEGGE